MKLGSNTHGCELITQTYSHILNLYLELKSRKIIEILDAGNPNVMDVAAQIEVTHEEMRYLKRCYAGGGNPALEFFNALIVVKADKLIGRLKEFCEEEHMIKASEILKKYDDNKRLNDIKPMDIHNLADATIPLNYWEILAERYGMHKKITTFRTAIKLDNQESPTRALLGLIDTKYCDTINIGVFLQHVRNANHTQAAEEIEKQIKDMISQ